jgi:hypothetical protein
MILSVRILGICVLLLSSGSNRSAHTKNDNVISINGGILNVGQKKEVKIPIKNTEDHEMVIDKVSVCCGNPKPTINTNTIKSSETAELVQEVKKTKPGLATIQPRIYFKQPKDKILFCSISVDVKQPITASIGWLGDALQKVEYLKEETRLNQVHQKGKDLLLHLSSKNNSFDLQNSLIAVESNYFSLSGSSLESEGQLKEDSRQSYSSIINKSNYPNDNNSSDRAQTKNSVKLILTLSPNSSLPSGELSDKIVITFRDGTECHVPIAFRSVGDIYGESSSIALGKIPTSKVTKKTFVIHFADKSWKTLNWKAEGVLSDSISISRNTQNIKDHTLILTIEIDPDFLPASSKGFLSTYIDFFEEKQEDKNIVRVLLYGYK